MTNYWKDHYDSNANNFTYSLLKQVGKTINGQDVSEHQINLIIKRISMALQLSSKDSVIDLCCGNGLITARISETVETISGFDFSERLIETARKHNNAFNIKYYVSDVLDLNEEILKSSTKFYMYEAVQHFSPKIFIELLKHFSIMENGTRIYMGGIPDKEKLRLFYDTNEKYEYYLLCEKNNKPHLGYWWFEPELTNHAVNNGFYVTKLPHESQLYTDYYRFDLLLEKC